jgi:hypothetical protein
MLYFVDTVGGSGGASNCVVNDGSSTCSSSATSTGSNYGSIALYKDGWPKPSWQAGVTGIPADGVRDIPDVSFFASDGWLSSSAYLICVSDDSACTYDSKTVPTAQEVGGTSVATPAMAGVMALINQKAGSSQGLPNQQLYELAAKQSYSSCSAETATTSNGCYFNDIDTGTIAMPCDDGVYNNGVASPNCTVTQTADTGGVGILSGYSAGTGYDLATGLGSLNVANVVNNWPVATGTAAASVTVTPASSSITTAQSLTVTVTVASSASGGATPTGTVTLASGSNTSYTSSETLSSGSYQFTIPAGSLTVGSDTLTATYWGDGAYALETGSASVTVTTSSTSSATFSLSPTTPSSISPGGSTTSAITVSTATGYVGTVTLACALTSSPTGASYKPSCSISPTTVALTSSTTSGTATATITTTAATSGALASPKLPGKSREIFGAAGGALLAFVVFLGIPARRRSWRSMLGVLVLMTLLGSLTACGGGGSSSSNKGTGTTGTTAGTYTFTVTGTGNDSVTTTETTTFAVTVD